MSFGFVSDEERKKRREQFDSNREKLGFGANASQGGLLGAGKLGQQAQLRVGAVLAPTPAQAQMQASVQAGRQTRNQALAQIETNKQEQAKTQAATLAEARKVVQLPVREQPQAVQQMKAQGQERAGLSTSPVVAKPSPNLGIGTTSNMVANQQARRQVVAPQLGIVSNTNAGVASNNNVSDKTIADEADALKPVYSDSPKLGFGANSVQRGNPDNKSFGLSVDNNAAVAQPLAPAMGGGNGGFGFTVMPPPRKAYGEDSRRAALAMDIKPPKNGMGLTTGQIALKNSILNGDDQKYANEQYTTQMNAAQKLAQEGMTQSGENSRAELNERGANSRAELSELGTNTRADNQLGFDAEKFQQVAALDNRKLDMQQSNDNVSNFAPKEINRLYKAFQAAETPEEQAAIREQMNIINGGGGSKGNYQAVSGGQAIDAESNMAYDLPMKSFNKDTGVFEDQPAAEIDFENDPRAQAIINNTALSKEEVRKQLEALR